MLMQKPFIAKLNATIQKMSGGCAAHSKSYPSVQRLA